MSLLTGSAIHACQKKVGLLAPKNETPKLPPSFLFTPSYWTDASRSGRKIPTAK